VLGVSHLRELDVDRALGRLQASVLVAVAQPRGRARGAAFVVSPAEEILLLLLEALLDEIAQPQLGELR
jgi:hypothetical protein